MLYLSCARCHLTIGAMHGADARRCPRCGGPLSRRPKSLFAGLPARYQLDREGSGSRPRVDARTTRTTSASIP
jgi:hypothetical protein